MSEVRAAVERKPRQRRRLPAGGEQQLPAGRTVEPGELNVRQREIRSEPQHDARRPRVRQDGALRRRGQSGPAGSGWACAPPPWAACSFIFLICAATLHALALKPTSFSWLVFRLLIASSGNEHQSLFFSM